MRRVAANGDALHGAYLLSPPAPLWAVPVDLVASGTCDRSEANALCGSTSWGDLRVCSQLLWRHFA